MSPKGQLYLILYERMYFCENLFDNVRVTVDSRLEYFSPITKLKYKENIIVEAKYNKDLDQNNFKNLSLTNILNMLRYFADFCSQS